jgi:hypothetical protein
MRAGWGKLALGAALGAYLSLVPFLEARYRVHQARCPCHRPAR